jgi:hypothetical protein
VRELVRSVHAAGCGGGLLRTLRMLLLLPVDLGLGEAAWAAAQRVLGEVAAASQRDIAAREKVALSVEDVHLILQAREGDERAAAAAARRTGAREAAADTARRLEAAEASAQREEASAAKRLKERVASLGVQSAEASEAAAAALELGRQKSARREASLVRALEEARAEAEEAGRQVMTY